MISIDAGSTSPHTVCALPHSGCGPTCGARARLSAEPPLAAEEKEHAKRAAGARGGDIPGIGRGARAARKKSGPVPIRHANPRPAAGACSFSSGLKYEVCSEPCRRAGGVAAIQPGAASPTLSPQWAPPGRSSGAGAARLQQGVGRPGPSEVVDRPGLRQLLAAVEAAAVAAPAGRDLEDVRGGLRREVRPELTYSDRAETKGGGA